MEKFVRKRKYFLILLPFFLAFGIYRTIEGNFYLLFFTVAVGVSYFGRDAILDRQWYKTSSELFKAGSYKTFPLVQLLLFVILIAVSLLAGAVAVKSFSLIR